MRDGVNRREKKKTQVCDWRSVVTFTALVGEHGRRGVLGKSSAQVGFKVLGRHNSPSPLGSLIFGTEAEGLPWAAGTDLVVIRIIMIIKVKG